MFEIILSKLAKKNLANLDLPIRRRISAAIDLLAHGLNANCKKLQGTRSDYRLRVGDYRVVFELIQDKLVIHIIRIAHRKDVYKN